MGRLTALKVKALTEPGRYGDGNGLWLQVRDAKHRSWLFRYTRHGKARQMGLGEASTELGRGLTLAEARDAAQAAIRVLRDGHDPIDRRRATVAAQREAETAGKSFQAVAEQYITAHEGGWRSVKHSSQWRATLTTYAFPKIGERPVTEIETAEVTAILEPIWQAKPETASRVRGRIEAVLDFALAHGWRKGENPARWRGHLSNLLPPPRKMARVRHHPALPADQVGAFLAQLRRVEGVAPRALELLILTACRTREVLGARWGEIDREARTWGVPAERMKGGRPHRVPLSSTATLLLDSLTSSREPDALLFPGRKDRPLSDMSLIMTVRRMNGGDSSRWIETDSRGAVVPHGFRSTFRDWASEQTSFSREVAEAALAHIIKDKTEAAYRRGDLFEKRRALMQAWADFCCAQPAPSAASSQGAAGD